MTSTQSTIVQFARDIIKSAGVPGLIAVFLVWTIAMTFTARMGRMETMLSNICELLARDLPFGERRLYCGNNEADEGYMQFFSGTIGSDVSAQ